jgi:putative hydrolase of the HAD superfamily
VAVAVLLDVGGVLTLPDPARVAAVVAGLGCEEATPGLVHRAHYRGVAVPVEFATEHTGDHWPIRLEQYVHCYVEELGVPVAAAEEARLALLDLFEGPAYGLWSWVQEASVHVIRELARRGVRLGVVSNADGSIERQLADAGVCQLGPGPEVEVDTIIDSGVVGVSKPDPAIFRFALAELEVPAEDVLYVGDTPAVDFVGATAAGIRAVIVDPYGLSGLGPEHTIRAIGELPALVTIG